jgi:serine/threonine-protein kinase
MVLVPAGAFEMGSNNGDSDEMPVHTVTLDDYYIDQYEVTNALYKACVDAGVCDPPVNTSSFTRDSYFGNSQYDDYPVIRVSWYDAKAYCEWRGVRLPTEAEWEKAARGTDGRTYPWGEGIDCTKANYGGCVDDTTAVGSYPDGASPYGLFDMAGNVWEWVADWYDGNYYDAYPADSWPPNPAGPSSGEYRVLRGGSWLNYGDLLRVANRSGYDPSSRFNFIGFRCALSP